MKRVPKKNISLVVRDVRAPGRVTLRPAPPASTNVILVRANATAHARTRVFREQQEKETHLSLVRVRVGTNSKSHSVSAHDIAPLAAAKDEIKKFLSYKKSTLSNLNTIGSTPRPPLKFRSRFGKRLTLGTFLVALLGAIIYGAGVWNFKRDGSTAFKSIYYDLQNSVRSFKDLKPEAAKASLLDVHKTLLGVSRSADRYGLFQVSKFLDSFFPALGALPAVFQNLQGFTGTLLSIADTFQKLKTSGLDYFVAGEGDKLLTLLRTLEGDSDKVAANSSNLMSEIKTLKSLPLSRDLQAVDVESNLPILTELYAAKDFLRGMISLLEAPGGFHFALFFQNPSEMRPTGGFIGSYADLFIQGGAIKNIDVRDIYDPDGQLDLRVVPPKPLQGTTISWGARDANWFFDFPTSAKKVLGFLQISKIYSEKTQTFVGALALNADILEDILGITGPISLPAYNLELSKDNFLAEVQKEVETGTNKSLNQPKKILKDFMPLLLDRLKSLSDDQKQQLMQILIDRAHKKDIQIYFRDNTLEAFIKRYGLAGDMFKAPDRFTGDYLSVVNANVAGGKSDIFIDQTTSLQSQIDSDGFVHNELSITRKHSGNTSNYSWYRASNQDYIKVYTLLGAKLVSLMGETEKTVYPRINYKHAGYATDTDVVAEESSESPSKAFFDGWLTTLAGTEKKIVFSYDNSEKVSLRDGATYTFIFDRQSGVRGGVNFNFEAPAGFKWRESDKPTYEYKNDDPAGRTTITLTLQEI